MINKTIRANEMKSLLLLFIAALYLFITYNSSAGQEDIIWMKPGHSGQIQCVKFSPDGKYLASVSSDQTLKVIDIERDSIVFMWTFSNMNKSYHLSFSDDGNYLRLGASVNNELYLYTFDIEQKSLLKTNDIVAGLYAKVIFSNDLKTVFLKYRTSYFQAYEVETGKRLYLIEQYQDSFPFDYKLTDNDSLVLGVHYDKLIFLNAKTGEFIRDLKFDIDSTAIINLTCNDKNIAFTNIKESADGFISIYNLENGQLVNHFQTDSNLKSIFFLNDNQTLLTTHNGSNVKIWNFQTGLLIDSIETISLNCLNERDIDPKTIIASGNSIFLSDFKNVKTNKLIADDYSILTMTNDGKYILTNKNKTITLWDRLSGNIIKTDTFDDNRNSFNLLPSRNMYWTYYNNNDEVCFLDLITDSLNICNKLSISHLNAEDFKFSYNLNYCLIKSYLHGNMIYDIINNKKISGAAFGSFDNQLLSTTGKYYSSTNIDGHLEVRYSDSTLIMAKIDTIKILATCFSFDEKYFITRTINSINIYVLPEFVLIKQIFFDDDKPSNINLITTKDNKYILDNSQNGLIRVWNFNTGNLDYTFNFYNLPVRTFNLSEDAKYVIAGYTDGTAVLWRYDETKMPVEEITSIKKSNINCYPNPFSDNTTINFFLEKPSNVKIAIYDVFGNEIIILTEGYQQSGNNQIIFNYDNLPEGIYFCRLLLGDKSETIRLIHIKSY
jgi:WD40 repeat protein